MNRTNLRKPTALDGEEFVFGLKLEPLDEGGFVATSPDIPGLVAQGATLAQTIDIARDVARKIVESCIEHGDPIPRLRRARRGKFETLLPVSVVP